MEQPNFDPEAHEEWVSARYRRIAMFDAFDKFMDLALEGVITREEAITAFSEEYADELKEPAVSDYRL